MLKNEKNIETKLALEKKQKDALENKKLRRQNWAKNGES